MRVAPVALAIGLSFVAAEVSAEVRFYLVPRIGNGQSVPLGQLSPTVGPFRPKYTDRGALGFGNDLETWSAMNYGSENAFLLSADVTPEQHTALSSQSDVLAVPNALESNVSGLAVTTIQNRLEAVNLPADWVSTSLTYRQVLRRIGKIILFAQRHQGLHALRVMDGVTLDLRWNQLTAQQQDRLRATADSLGLDTSGVTNTMTLRQILRVVGDQVTGFDLLGEAF